MGRLSEREDRMKGHSGLVARIEAHRMARSAIWFAEIRGRPCRRRGFQRAGITIALCAMVMPARLHPGYDKPASPPLGPEPDHHVDAADLVAVWDLRQFADDRGRAWNVDQLVLALDEEVMVIRHIGVEIGF